MRCHFKKLSEWRYQSHESGENSPKNLNSSLSDTEDKSKLIVSPGFLYPCRMVATMTRKSPIVPGRTGLAFLFPDTTDKGHARRGRVVGRSTD
jgi:hypothetical protein